MTPRTRESFANAIVGYVIAVALVALGLWAWTTIAGWVG